MRALVFSIDDAYVMPFKVLWHSLVRTDSVPERTPIFILHEATLSTYSKENLCNFFDSYGRKVVFLDVGDRLPNDLPLKESDHVSKATFYRLFVSSLLPREVESAVYLDSDAIVVRSIRDLFTLQLTEPIAAADHMAPDECYRFWGPYLGRYFQAGVLVIDLKKWRNQNYEAKFKRIIANRDSRIKWWDQDILNISFQNTWQAIPIWFNTCFYVRENTPEQDISSNVRYLHYDGTEKPWKVYRKTPHIELWYQAYKLTFGIEFDKNSIKERLTLNRVLNIARKVFRHAASLLSG